MSTNARIRHLEDEVEQGKLRVIARRRELRALIDSHMAAHLVGVRLSEADHRAALQAAESILRSQDEEQHKERQENRMAVARARHRATVALWLSGAAFVAVLQIVVFLALR